MIVLVALESSGKLLNSYCFEVVVEILSSFRFLLPHATRLSMFVLVVQLLPAAVLLEHVEFNEGQM